VVLLPSEAEGNYLIFIVYEFEQPIDPPHGGKNPKEPYSLIEQIAIDAIMDFLANNENAYHDIHLREDIWYFKVKGGFYGEEYLFFAKLDNDGTTFLFSTAPLEIKALEKINEGGAIYSGIANGSSKQKNS
jgi:hypothetical protein